VGILNFSFPLLPEFQLFAKIMIFKVGIWKIKGPSLRQRSKEFKKWH
jgi:hypothetical protein